MLALNRLLGVFDMVQHHMAVSGGVKDRIGSLLQVLADVSFDATLLLLATETTASPKVANVVIVVAIAVIFEEDAVRVQPAPVRERSQVLLVFLFARRRERRRFDDFQCDKVVLMFGCLESFA